MKTIIILLFIALLPVGLSAQEHDHDHGLNEIGISPGATYSPSHHNWGFGLHAHYFRKLSEHCPWSLGASVEQVYSHGSHWTISTGAKYTFLDKLNLAVMPGITFFRHNHEEHAAHGEEDEHPGKAQFSIHFELGYDLVHLKNFHFGPAIDYSWSRHDTHFMLGVHCAYGF